MQILIYLDVNIDSELNMSFFAEEINRKMTNKMFKLAKLRYMVDEYTAISIYRQTILPYANYCSFILDSVKKTIIDELQVLQNQALRICLKCKMRDETVIGLHKRCEIPLHLNRRNELLTSLMYRKS